MGLLQCSIPVPVKGQQSEQGQGAPTYQLLPSPQEGANCSLELTDIQTSETPDYAQAPAPQVDKSATQTLALVGW